MLVMRGKKNCFVVDKLTGPRVGLIVIRQSRDRCRCHYSID